MLVAAKCLNRKKVLAVFFSSQLATKDFFRFFDSSWWHFFFVFCDHVDTNFSRLWFKNFYCRGSKARKRKEADEKTFRLKWNSSLKHHQFSNRHYWLCLTKLRRLWMTNKRGEALISFLISHVRCASAGECKAEWWFLTFWSKPSRRTRFAGASWVSQTACRWFWLEIVMTGGRFK